MLLAWDANAWESHLWWQAPDRNVLRRVKLLIQDVQRNGNDIRGIWFADHSR